MREFDVKITETLSKTVTVEAENLAQSEAVAEQNWRKNEYILDADNFVGVEFEGIEPEREKVHPASEKSWSDVFGTFDYTPYDAAQQAELKAAEEMGLPIQMYARPEYSAVELSQMREVFAKTAFVKAGPDAAYAEGLHPEPGFKDGYIYDNFPDKVCYIPENWDFDEDGPGITANDILEMCDGDKLKADIVFDMCEWEHPNTILVDWGKEQEAVLVEALSKKLHVMYEATGDFLFEKASKTLDYYRNFGSDLFDLSVAIGEFVEDVDLGVVERLVHEGHDKELVCDVLRCNRAEFDENGKYICGKEKASQPLNQQIRNAAGRAGEGVNNTLPKDKGR